MKHIFLTFDDGRKNNYSFAIPILESYGLKSTFFITTGYVDGSWAPIHGTWLSAGPPMSIEDVVEISKNDNFEIGLHGDKHVMQLEDFEIAKRKLDSWLGDSKSYGFSIPNSSYSLKEYVDFESACKSSILYIRAGGIKGKNDVFSKIKKACRVYCASKKYYTDYYKTCIFECNNIPEVLPAVGVRRRDSVEQIKALINSMKTDSSLIFMLHSIVPSDSKLLNDDWAWSKDKFEELCKYLSAQQDVETLKLCELKK